MKTYNADRLFKQLKRAYAERIARNGFDDKYLYNDELLKLDELDLNKFDKLKKIIGKSSNPLSKIVINKQGFDGDEYTEIITDKKPRTPEEKERARRKAQRLDAIKILRGISIRMPLLIYGADIPFEEDFTLEMFFDDDIVDAESWAEFMPAGVTKDFFREFIKYYDRDIFIGAGRKIRALAKDADNFPPLVRVQKIADIFATFKNPDKETVLTPFNVVKLHIDSAFDKNFFTPDKHILEINSKSGLYPLYVAEKIYRATSEVESFDIWDKIIAENIFVLCKTPMAQRITRRTLVGFRNAHVNAKFFPNLIETLKVNPVKFRNDVLSKSFWYGGNSSRPAQTLDDIFDDLKNYLGGLVQKVSNKYFWQGGGTMFFDAVVGNPPYQVTGSGDNKNFATPIYHLFMENSFKLADKVSLITPARFLFNAGATPADFMRRMLNDPHLKVIEYRIDSRDFFPTSDIKGGVVITLRDAKKNFGAIKLFIPFDELIAIHQKAVLDNKNFKPLSEIMRGQMTYRLSAKAYEDFPDLPARLPNRTDTALRTNAFEVMPDIFLKDKPNDGRDYFEILGKLGTERVYRFVRREYMEDIPEFKTWKVFLPAANGSGALGEVVSTPLVGATQTFITVGAFDSEAEARACLAYIKSKFCRAMLGILKVTQHNPPATWAKVPLQDFTSASDIDWSGDVDAQLYKKYNLDAAEVKFIEEKVRAMD